MKANNIETFWRSFGLDLKTANCRRQCVPLLLSTFTFHIDMLLKRKKRPDTKSHKKEFSVPADQSCTLCALALFTKLQKLIKTFYGSLSLLLPWRDTWKKTVIEFGWATICWRNLNDSVPIFFYKCFERPVNGDHWSPTKIKLWREMKLTCCKLQTMLASMVYRMITSHIW